MKLYLHLLSLFLLLSSLTASSFFVFQVREENQLLDDLIYVNVRSKDLNDTEQIAISLSEAIYKLTN